MYFRRMFRHFLNRTKGILLFGLLLTGELISCKKSTPNPTPAELLPQLWYVSYFTKMNFNANGDLLSIDTLMNGNGNDYVDFRDKPWAYMHIGSLQDTVPYNLLSNTSLLFDQDTMILNGVNANTLQYSKSYRQIAPYYDLVYRYYR